MHRLAVVFLFSLVGVLAGCASSPKATVHHAVAVLPEGASGYVAKSGWTGARFAVAAANPLATSAGYQILKEGGSAVDAAIAAQMVLALVEPQSSGIGGGAFLLHYDGKGVAAYDGRETAPAAVTESLFLGADGKPMAFVPAVVGGRSVGTPGAVRMLEMAHRQHGKLPWAALFKPAIVLAQEGFSVSPRLHTLLRSETELQKDPVAFAYFFQSDGTPHPVGHLLRNPALAEVLKKIAHQGANALMQGEVAQAMVDKVKSHRTNPGVLEITDLAHYQPIQRKALCHDVHVPARVLQVCGFPPPSSGAIAIGQILGMLSHTSAATLPLDDGLPTADWLHLYTEASRLAFADRAQYVADPAFVSAPAGDWMSLLNPDYLAERAKHIGQAPFAPSIKVAPPGVPGVLKAAYAPMSEQEEHGTSHISVVDGDGNAVAMTSTIESAFGSRQMVNVQPDLVGGFMLNNQLTDFSFTPRDDKGMVIANRVQPGKRPRSSMAPTLVFDKTSGTLLMTGGSPGGALIIHFTAKTLYGVFYWGMTPQVAINLPNFASLNGPTLLEEKRFPLRTIDALNARGHEVRQIELTSGLQAISRQDAADTVRWLGGADPRREGVVLGD